MTVVPAVQQILTRVFDLSVLVLLAQAVLEHNVDLLVGEALAQRQQSVGQLSRQHGAVLVLVVQLQALNEVLVAALLLLVLHLAVDGQELLQRQQLLVALLGLADLLDQGQGGVAVQRAQHIAQVEGVDLLRAVGIVDAERELGLCFGCVADRSAISIITSQANWVAFFFWFAPLLKNVDELKPDTEHSSTESETARSLFVYVQTRACTNTHSHSRAPVCMCVLTYHTEKLLYLDSNFHIERQATTSK